MDKGVFAGIYKTKGEPFESAEFAINYNGSLCFLFDDISDIFSDVEHGIYDMELVPGYALGIKKSSSTDEMVWQIRDSGKKHLPDYIIKEGTFSTPRFIESLRPFFKAMSHD